MKISYNIKISIMLNYCKISVSEKNASVFGFKWAI